MLARIERKSDLAKRAGIAAIFFFLWIPWRGYWLDDAFITFRYARNLAEGLGPVFNPGEAVEGYTTFLWMIVCAIPFGLLSDALALRAIDFMGGALGIFVVWRAMTFPGPDGTSRARWLVMLLALSPTFVINCGDGMETPLFMALLLESARAFVREPSQARTTQRDAALTGALTAGCVLTRPEALPLVVALPALLALTRKRDAGSWCLGFGAGVLPPILLHLGWRLWFYGAPFPNTFLAKATGAVGPRLESGLADVGSFLTGTGAIPPVWLWLGLGLALFGLRSLWRDPLPAARTWLAGLWLIVLFRVAFDVWSGSESMGSFRFLAPALPPLFVLADEGAQALRRGWPRAVLASVAVAALVASAFSNVDLLKARAPYREGLETAHVALGQWLAETRAPGTWVAIGDAGVVPFYSRLPIIDLWGLNDATIARLPGEYGDRVGVADHALERRPGVIVLWNLAPIQQDPGRLRILGAQPFDREIAGHPVFRDEYRFLREFQFRAAGTDPAVSPGYYLDVFEHRPAGLRRPAS